MNHLPLIQKYNVATPNGLYLYLMKNISWRYWACQILGWGVWSLIGIYMNLWVYNDLLQQTYGDRVTEAKNKYLLAVGVTFLFAILITHLLRFILKKFDWVKYTFNHLIFVFLISSIATGFLIYYTTDLAEKKLHISLDEIRAETLLEKAKETEKKLGIDKIPYYADTSLLDKEQSNAIAAVNNGTRWHRNTKGEWVYSRRSDIINIYLTIVLACMWLLIYFVWHYITKSRKDQIDRIKLESTVKELELKTIKAHINPHFIFNSLNSIRALVDENPQRARGAITELSNLLRSSMQVEKNETVTLEKEMKIVEDYLALEKIRFEDRLNVELHIDEDTLDQQVPPMMVQTLVENAIKHGISKQMQGGVIKIHSDFVNSHYELKVENTGTLNESLNNDGFGLKSTQDRLKLLFGAHSTFNIKQETENTVAVTVALPVKINN